MVRIDDVMVDTRLVVFDKDGTLIDFESLWHPWLDKMLEILLETVPLSGEALAGLASSLGFDLRTRKWDTLSPLTLASTQEVSVIMASQIYRYCHVPWAEALDRVEQANEDTYEQLPMEELVQPIGDVRGLLERLRAAGIRTAMLTSDDRKPTAGALTMLDWGSCFDAVICGDDGFAQKPAPDAALEICRRLSVAPEDALMVGDTVVDMQMARRAGFGMAVGVTSGALTGDLLARYADLVVSSIHAIEIVNATARETDDRDAGATL